jgi:hypothetical protein
MSKYVESSLSFGLKILLSVLLHQINEHNFELIKLILNKSYIENNIWNQYYHKTIYNIMDNSNYIYDHIEFKNYLIKIFKENKFILKDQLSNSLCDQYILYPINEILYLDNDINNTETSVISYNIHNINSNNLKKKIINEYKLITDFEVVMILKQKLE